MEYVFKTDQPFNEAVADLMDALEERKFTVHCSFDMNSALEGQTAPTANYSVLLVYPFRASHLLDADSSPEPVRPHLVAIYERGNNLVINLLSTPTIAPSPTGESYSFSEARVREALVAVLVEKGWWSMDDGASPQDPVCGKRIERDRAHAVLDYEGTIYYLCCPLCQAQFERDPARYARSEAEYIKSR